MELERLSEFQSKIFDTWVTKPKAAICRCICTPWSTSNFFVLYYFSFSTSNTNHLNWNEANLIPRYFGLKLYFGNVLSNFNFTILNFWWFSKWRWETSDLKELRVLESELNVFSRSDKNITGPWKRQLFNVWNS